MTCYCRGAWSLRTPEMLRNAWMSSSCRQISACITMMVLRVSKLCFKTLTGLTWTYMVSSNWYSCLRVRYMSTSWLKLIPLLSSWTTAWNQTVQRLRHWFKHSALIHLRSSTSRTWLSSGTRLKHTQRSWCGTLAREVLTACSKRKRTRSSVSSRCFSRLF